MEIKLTNVDKSQELKLEPSILKGEKGDKGDKGDNGIGVPAGGDNGNFLVKKSDDDYDTKWIDLQVDIGYFYGEINTFWAHYSELTGEIEEIKQRLDNLEK